MRSKQAIICRLLGLGLFILAVFCCPQRAQAVQPNPTNRLHMYSKPAVVRILSGHTGRWQWLERQWNTQYISSGSGFFIHSDGYILTNAHVVSAIKDGDEPAKRHLLQMLAVQFLRAINKPVTDDNLNEVAKVMGKQNPQLVDFQRVNYVFVQSGKRYPYEIKSYGAPTGEGKDLAVGKDVSVIKVEVKNAPTLPLGNSDAVQVGDKIYVMGYPAAADSDVLDAKSALEPTTNDGAISARKTSSDGAPILQTNANTTHGNSGGPAINDKGEVVGLLTFRGDTVGGQEVQGFNFLVPTNTAQEFVRQAGTESKLGQVDTKWRKGLELFWDEHYSKARDEFREVLALYPEHSEAQRLVTEAQEHIVKGEDKPESSGAVVGVMVVGAVGFGALILLGGAVVLVVLLTRKKKQPAPMMTPAMAGPYGAAPAYGAVPMPQPVPMPSPINPQPGLAQQQAARMAASPGGYGPPMQAAAPVRAQPARTEVFQAAVTGPKLVALAGPLQGQEFMIGNGMFIGRDGARAQIVVADSQVSSQHVWIGPLNGRIVARDPGSTNGTYLNNRMDQRISDVVLNDRDVLILGARGTVKFQFQG